MVGGTVATATAHLSRLRLVGCRAFSAGSFAVLMNNFSALVLWCVCVRVRQSCIDSLEATPSLGSSCLRFIVQPRQASRQPPSGVRCDCRYFPKMYQRVYGDMQFLILGAYLGLALVVPWGRWGRGGFLAECTEQGRVRSRSWWCGSLQCANAHSAPPEPCACPACILSGPVVAWALYVRELREKGAEEASGNFSQFFYVSAVLVIAVGTSLAVSSRENTHVRIPPAASSQPGPTSG